MNQNHKNIILLVSSVADSLFAENSRKRMEYTNELDKRVEKLIQKDQDKIFGYIDVLRPRDQRHFVDVFKDVREQRVTTLRLNSRNLLDSDNDFNVVEEDGSVLRAKGTLLEFLLRPEDFEIHICGVDTNGYFKRIIPELLEAGYDVTLYSDLIKRYRGNEEILREIRDPKFTYCSSRVALAQK